MEETIKVKLLNATDYPCAGCHYDKDTICEAPKSKNCIELGGAYIFKLKPEGEQECEI